MQNFQFAIVQHINNSGIDFKTVKPYAGEIKFSEKGVHLRDPLPACYILFQTGNPGGDENNLDFACIFDLIVVTESKTFDRQTKLTANLQEATQLVEYLFDNMIWEYGGQRYHLDQEETPDVNIQHQDDRFTAIAITAKFRRA